ncbi:MAG: porin [Rhodobacteraceae bacterium]|nr:porin [Paracoccaceae bacterium]
MKKVLLATSILAATAGFAAAEVTLSGSARMGVIDDFGADNTGFTSRARVVFTLSGETDGGLSFGATFRADNASAANSGDAGEVFISGAFGKLTMGDIDGAAQQVVGNVDGVGLTGLSDLNEAVYLGAGDGGSDPTAAYEYSSGAFTGIISATNPDNNQGALGTDLDSTLALGVKYATDAYTVALGYEDADGDVSHIILGASATFGAISLKANYGQASVGAVDADQYHLSATYSADALSVTAFYTDEEDFVGLGGSGKAYGLGASYDLGGGAKVVGGYAKNDTADTSAVDLGVSFSF